jgi:hypothetical protein
MAALREFVANLLESEGAAIEVVEPDGLDVLAPEPLRAALDWPELVRLGFGATLPSGAIAVGLEGDWLNRFGALLGDRGRVAERQLAAPRNPAPPNDPERLIDRALSLPNAVWRLKGVKSTWAKCLLVAFRYTAISDEKREGLIWLGFNCGTGAVLDQDLLGRLRRGIDHDAEWLVPDAETRHAAGPGWDAATIATRARPLIDHLVRQDLDPFLGAMRRRLDRDRRRIHEYHDELRRSALLKLAAIQRSAGDKAEASAQRETMRVAAIEREYAAKLDDLRHNYALSVTVEWVQRLVLFAPVYRYYLLIKRRKGERGLAIDWHPVVRQMELPPSDWGHGLGHERLVCDDRLHLTEPSGQAPCSSCGKEWCRACHSAACPRCRRATCAINA